jgi:hypothetical protein
MTRRTVMAARFGPASLRSGPRSVYIHVPETTGPDHQDLIDAVLRKLIRYDDRLIYPDTSAGADPVIRFAERYGLFADPLAGESAQPDLTIDIVDPAGDNTLGSLARVLAEQQGADLIITELPVILA